LALVEEVEDTLHGEETVWVALLTDTLHEDGEVVMVVKLANFDLPLDLVAGSVLNLDGKISTVVESAELRRGDGSSFHGAGAGSESLRGLLGLVQGGNHSTVTLTTLGEVYKRWQLS
jgi:hypothetical protein